MRRAPRVNIKGGDDIFTLGTKLNRIPDAPAADRNYMPAYSVAEDGYTRLASALNMRLDERFSLRAQLGYSDVTMYRHRASDKIVNDAGDYTMSRNYYNAEKLTTGGLLAFDAHLRTGSVEHSLTLAHSEEWTTYKYAAPYANQNVAFSGTSNLYSPIPWPDDKAGATVGQPDREEPARGDDTRRPHRLQSALVRARRREPQRDHRPELGLQRLPRERDLPGEARVREAPRDA